MSTYIGIDPGRRMGWCVLSEAGVVSDSYDIGPHGSKQLRALYGLLGEVLKLHYRHGPLLLCYEEPAMLRGHALTQIQRMLGVIMLFCEFEDVPHYPVNQSTLKAFIKSEAGIEGKVDKEAIVKATQAREPGISDHNEADAYWLALYGRDMVADDSSDE